MTEGGNGLLPGSFVERVAALYDDGYDKTVLVDSFRGPIVERGYLTLDELARIVEWKSRRMKSVVLWNVPETVEAVTRQAFACAEPWLAVWILSYLSAVNTRMASAILSVYDPGRYTVIDVRAWRALDQLGVLGRLGLADYGGIEGAGLNSPETYAAYLDACARLAGEAGVSLRTLDRCLWIVGGLGASGLAEHGIRMPSVAQQTR